jgi:nitrite reductase/ring-hydroxylating ferredoxin subunit
MDQDNFIPALPRAELPENAFRCVMLRNLPVLVACAEGQVHAVHNQCSHAMGSFDRGRLRGHILLCPHHGARFDVRNGACLGGPADQPIAHYKVRLHNGMIEVLVPNTDDAPNAE